MHIQALHRYTCRSTRQSHRQLLSVLLKIHEKNLLTRTILPVKLQQNNEVTKNLGIQVTLETQECFE